MIMNGEEETEMEKKYFTIAGTNYRYGTEFMKPGMKVKLVKEPDNEVDKEAIKVEMEGLGIVGYVSATYKTRIGESLSAGRLYDKIGDTATGTVLYVLPQGVLCTLDEGTIEEPKVVFDDNDLEDEDFEEEEAEDEESDD